MYSLLSRYYDPETGRFINADSQLNPGTGLTGINMFAYCNNNPVNMADPNGHMPFFVITAAIGAVVGAVAGGIIAAKTGNNVWAGIGIGAAGGALLGCGVGAGLGMISGAGAAATAGQVGAGLATLATAAGDKIVAGVNKVSNAISSVGSKTSTALYSGGEKALQAARDSGGKIIDDTISGKITNLVTKLPFVDHQAAWAQTSANFASKATGIVNAYVYAPAYRGVESIFWSVEMPALMNNPNVTGVVIHIFGD